MTGAKQVTQAVGALREARATLRSPSEPGRDDVPRLYGQRRQLPLDDRRRRRRDARAVSQLRVLRASQTRGWHRADRLASVGRTPAPAAPTFDLPARGDAAAARDRLDAERWFDDGGSFNSKAATR